VLSGFLISGLLFTEFEKTGRIDVARFLLRRGLKIWPGYYCFVLFSLFLSSAFGQPATPKAVVVNAVFLQNYVHFHRFALVEHSWSLAIEEHFYIILPFLLVCLIRFAPNTGRSPFSAIPKIFLVLAPSCLAMRAATPLPEINRALPPTHLHIDSLFAGVFLQYLFRFVPNVFEKISRWPSLFIAAACCVPAFLFDSHSRLMQTFEFTFLYVAFAILVTWSVRRDPTALFGRRLTHIIAGIGKYPYSIYLWHIIIAILFWMSRVSSATEFWIYLLLSLSIGILMGELIEMPVLRIRDRIFAA
jgi:peptidoglycan/LPS O-acetylase OafA/YrhL